MWFVIAVLIALAGIPALLIPPYPVNDAALFEYYGRAIIHGARLYRDLLDVKPPSIYFVNALMQWAFGSNYFLHTLAEAILNGASIVLFVLLARTLRTPAPWSGTVLFAAPFCFSIPYNTVQHDATFFILLGFLLAARGAPLAAGCACALASTFWLQSVLILPALLVVTGGHARRVQALLSYGGTLAAYAMGLRPLLGADWLQRMTAVWGPNLALHPSNPFAIIPLIVASSLTGASIIALLLLVAATWRGPLESARAFALVWSACALVAAFVPLRVYPIYLVPLIPALAMTIATFGVSPVQLRQRAVLAVAATAAMLVAVRNGVAGTETAWTYARLTHEAGMWIANNAGNRRVLYTDGYYPELYLASGAVPVSPDGIVANDLRLSASGYTLVGMTRRPDLVVLGDPRINSLTIDYVYYSRVCPRQGLGKDIVLLAVPEVGSRFSCTEIVNPD